jgi:hypothetical protein
MNKMVQNILRSSAKLALGAFVLAASFGSVSAQNPPTIGNPLWKMNADTLNAPGKWFTNDNNTRGIAYNAATGNLLVVSRTGGVNIRVIRASTGEVLSQLNVTGVAGGTFAASLIDVTPNGRIFVANLTLNATTGPLKIYTWANEGATPTVAYEGNAMGTALRFGDSFRIDWTDGARDLYVGGSGNPNLLKLTFNGETGLATETAVFNFGAANNATQRAVRGMSPIAGQDSLWINEFEYTMKKISTVNGAIGTIVPATAFPTREALWVDYANIGGTPIAAVFPANLIASGQSASLVNLATGAELGFTATGTRANGNGAGGAILDASNKMMYLLATNNHIAAYDISSLVGGADYVNVKFTVNTSTIRDTVKTTDLVQIRGVVNDSERANYFGQTINWGSGSVALQNAGGDYWTRTMRLAPGDVLKYKIYTAKPGVDGMVDHATGGWEGGSDKFYTVPANASGDITLPVIFYNRTNPLEHTKSDTIAVRFRVNVGAAFATGDLKETSVVGVRGTVVNDWGASAPVLTREPLVEGNRNVFYSGVAYLPATNAGRAFQYKYVIENGATILWDTDPNRQGKVGRSDTTIYFSFFQNRRPPSRPIVNASLQFAVNVGVLEELGFFNRAVGDSILVRGGFNGFGTGSKAAFNAVTNNWVRNENITAEAGSVQKYKYFIQWDPSRFVVDGPNYIRNLTPGNGWEEPGQFGGGDREYTFTESTTQDIGETFYNSIPPYAVIRETRNGNRTLPVTFRVDMSAALNHSEPFNPASDSVFLFIESTYFALTQGLPVGDELVGPLLNSREAVRNRILFTPVPNQPNIYELTLNVTLPTENHIGFTVVYRKSNGNVVYSGPRGFNSGRRYYRYIRPLDDADLTNIIWPDNARLSPIFWKSGALDFEAPLCYCEQEVSVDRDAYLASEYALSQNYPNPFNPSTTISFNLPQSGNVTLTVYNVLGQQVATLVNGALNAGTHSVPFNASRLASGVYIYELRAGSFVQQKRMMLVK